MIRFFSRTGTRGQAAILATVTLVVTLGMVGMVVDVGWSYFKKTAAKTAAEAAATAAAVAASTQVGFNCGLTVPCPSWTACPASPTTPPSDVLQNGCLYAKQNGFVNFGRQTVTYTAATGSSPVAGVNPAYSVSFTVSENVPQLFAAVLGHQVALVSARATTGIFLAPQGACIYTLDPSAPAALFGNGTMNVNSTCGAYVNSGNANAMEAKGGAVFNASVVRIHGGYRTTGNAVINPAPQTGQDPVADPFAHLPWPTPPARCDSMGIGSNTTIMMPADGWYVVCGNISLSGNPNFNFPPGKYFVKGGVSWNNGTIRGTDVTFFLSSTNYQGVDITGGRTELSAPSTGTYRGVLFFQDRAVTSSGSDSKFVGNTNWSLTGSLYFPTTNVKFAGGSDSQNNYTGLIGRTVEFKGNSYFTADTNGLHTGLGLPRIGLIE